MDSLKSTDTKVTKHFLENQNFTDFEKCLQYFEKNFKRIKSIQVFGGSGKSTDHLLGNLSVAKKYINKFDIQFNDEFNKYFLANQSLTLHSVKNKIISIIPFPEVEGISSKGLKYSLKREYLKLGKNIGIRNKALISNVKINFQKGTIIIFIEHYKC